MAQAWGGNLWGTAQPSAGGGGGASATSQAVYGNTGGMQALAGTPSWLLIVTAAEVLVLIGLRHGFRNYHGG